MRVLLLLAFLVMLAPLPARAEVYADQGEARAVCHAHAAAAAANPLSGAFSTGRHCEPDATQSTYLCQLLYNGNYRPCRYVIGVGNPADMAYQSTVTCTARNATYPPGNKTGSAIPIPRCYGGCEILGTETKYTAGGISLYGMSNRYYTGNTCAGTINANAPIDAWADQRADAAKTSDTECTAVGNGQTACMKPNGDYCATASTGTTFCWQPTQEGAQVNGEEAQRKSEVDKPVTPPDVSIPDKDWQRKEGHQAQACVNNTCKTYNVTNYGTVPKGTAKNSTGNNSPDGTGNTSGNGKPTDSNNGTEDGEGNTASGGECGSGYVWSGDPIMGNILNETHKTRCQDSEFRTGFINEIQGADTSDGTGEVNADTLWGTADEGELEFDTSGLGWGRACPPPPEVFGQVLDFSALCEFAGMVGLLVLAIAHMHALYIFMGD